MKQTAVTFRQAKGQRKLAMLTAYDATIARLMDDHVDAVLVGDSLGMVMLGQPDTLSVTMDQMIHHCAAVSRGLTKPLLVCDMPFMSYHLSPQQACANAIDYTSSPDSAGAQSRFCEEARRLRLNKSRKPA